MFGAIFGATDLIKCLKCFTVKHIICKCFRKIVYPNMVRQCERKGYSEIVGYIWSSNYFLTMSQ